MVFHWINQWYILKHVMNVQHLPKKSTPCHRPIDLGGPTSSTYSTRTRTHLTDVSTSLAHRAQQDHEAEVQVLGALRVVPDILHEAFLRRISLWGRWKGGRTAKRMVDQS